MPCLSPGERYDRRVSREGGTLPPNGRPRPQSARQGNVAPTRLGLVGAGVSAGAIRYGPVPGASVGAVDAGATLTRLMSLRERAAPPLGIIEPCLPSPAKAPPSGPGWIHEIKHDGFRILARRDSTGVRLITRNGNDFAARFPLIASTVAALPTKSCVIDGEAIVCDENGLAVFDLIRGHGSKTSAVLCAFDLLELDGKDLRRRPIEERKGLLAKLLHGSDSNIGKLPELLSRRISPRASANRA
jgi:ATP-dependent DNA ligase